MTQHKKAPSGEYVRALLAKADKMLAQHKAKYGEPPSLGADHHETLLRNRRRTRLK